jgi:MFS family permease
LSLRSNITKLYLIKIAKWFMLYMPIVVPFYKANGLGMKDVMLLQGVYSVTIVILEIPSGYFADVLGRKSTLIIGAFMGFLGFLTYSLSFGFWGFLIAETVLGIGQSFVSGSDSALLYDSLLDMKREGDYIKFEGRITSIGNLAEAIAGTLGGLLAAVSVRYPYIAQTFIAFIAVPSALLLTEPSRHKRLLKMRFNDIFRVVRYSLIENKPLKRNIFFSSVIGTATLTMAWFVQPFFEHVHLSLHWYGLLWTALNLTVGIVAFIAYRIESRIGPVNSVVIIALLVPAGYITLYFFNSIYALSILFLFYIVRGFATPVLKDYINRMTGSEIRATVLSVRNFIIRLIFAAVGPFLGWYMDVYSLPQAMLLAGIIFLVVSGFLVYLFTMALKSAGGQKFSDV